MVFAEECWHKTMKPLMEEVRKQMGNMPVYFTFDIDGIDPTCCPGTGMALIKVLSILSAVEWKSSVVMATVFCSDVY